MIGHKYCGAVGYADDMCDISLEFVLYVFRICI